MGAAPADRLPLPGPISPSTYRQVLLAGFSAVLPRDVERDDILQGSGKRSGDAITRGHLRVVLTGCRSDDTPT